MSQTAAEIRAAEGYAIPPSRAYWDARRAEDGPTELEKLAEKARQAPGSRYLGAMQRTDRGYWSHICMAHDGDELRWELGPRVQLAAYIEDFERAYGEAPHGLREGDAIE